MKFVCFVVIIRCNYPTHIYNFENKPLHLRLRVFSYESINASYVEGYQQSLYEGSGAV